MDGGFIEMGILIKRRPIRVRQIAAHAMGDRHCAWRTEKKRGEVEKQ